MKAYWLDNRTHISVQELKVHGIEYVLLNPANYQSHLERVKTADHYIFQDILELTTETPNLDAILAKSGREHIHSDEMVRFILAGNCIFDIRSNDDRWMRVELSSSDFISVPAHRNHRFFVMDDHSFRCVRLFKRASGLTHIYRPKTEAALA